jgi:hypothetical protein
VFLPTQWGKLESHDELLNCATPRGEEGKEFNQVAPPAVTYWCLADPGRQYIVYARGLRTPVTLSLSSTAGAFSAMQFDPRSGERKDLGPVSGERFEYQPPDEQDWVVLVRAGE